MQHNPRVLRLMHIFLTNNNNNHNSNNNQINTTQFVQTMEQIRLATATAISTTPTTTTTITDTDTDYASAVSNVYACVYDNHLETKEEINLAIQLGFLTTSLSLTTGRLNKDVPWIAEKGRCLDHI